MAKSKGVSQQGGSAGLPADAAGNPAIDPTSNVIALVDLNVRRLDDLRAQHAQHVDAVMELTRETQKVRAECVQEIADLRDRHAKELRDAEAARIDANRATDLAAVAAAAQVSATSVQALAKSTTDIAEAARASVTQSATVVGDNLTRTIDPITRRLDEIQRVQTLQLGAQAGSQVVTAERRLTVAQSIGIASVIGVFMSVLVGIVAVVLSS